ncbi:MAG: class I SAM-dependent methyltransferase [Dehalococcoidia bacterium]|nr:class I SAM-dependent methyltransferase [Dehalococcoidia bacterium]
MPDDSGPITELGMGEPPPRPVPVDFTPAELSALGNISGMRVLDLTAGIGDHGLGLARLGAEVVSAALDSEIDVEEAAIAAAEFGLDVWFATGGYVELDDETIGDGFDIVYAGPNTLAWIEDLHDWFVDSADALNPGCRLVMFDEHPAARQAVIDAGGASLEEESEDESEFEEVLEEVLEEAFDDEFIPDIPDWTVADVQAALAAAGMHVVEFRELTGAQRFTTALDVLDEAVAEQLADVPAAFLLIAEVPAG